MDAAVAPGRVLPGQPQHKCPDRCRYRGTAPPVWVAPAASDQVPMPAQQRLRPDEQPAPARARQQTCESSKHSSVGPVERWPGHLAPQHRDLMAQRQQLRVLGGRASRQQREPPQYLAEQQIQQSKSHTPIIAARWLPRRTRSSAPTTEFLAPTGPDARDSARPTGTRLRTCSHRPAARRRRRPTSSHCPHPPAGWPAWTSR